MKFLEKSAVWLLIGQLSGFIPLLAQPVIIQPGGSFGARQPVGSGVENLRVVERSPDGTEVQITMDYRYDGFSGPVAQLLPVIGKKGQGGISAWFGADPVTVGRGRGTITIKARYFNDEIGVPPMFTSDQIRILILNQQGTAIVAAVPFLKTIQWGSPDARPAAKPAPTFALIEPGSVAKAAEEKRIAQAKSRAEAEAQRIALEQKQAAQEVARIVEEKRQADEKEVAEAKARDEARRLAEAEERARDEAETRALAEAKVRDEARRKAEAEEQRYAEEKKVAERARKEAETKRIAENLRRAEEKALAEAKARQEARNKAEAEESARKEAEAKALAEAKHREQEQLRADAELKRIEQERKLARAKLVAEEKAREEARLKAVAVAENLARENRAIAEAKARDESENRASQTAPLASPAGIATPSAQTLAIDPSLKTKITNVDVVNRSLDRSQMTFGVEFDYKDKISDPMLGIDVVRQADAGVSQFFQTRPVQIGKSRRNFILFPVKFQPPDAVADREAFATDKVLVYLAEKASSRRYNLFPATMLLMWRAPGSHAVAATGSGNTVEIEDFKQNDASSGYVSVKYALASGQGQLRARVYDSKRPDAADSFLSNIPVIKAGRGLQLIDVRINEEAQNQPEVIHADTLEIVLADADGKILARVSKTSPMVWARPK